MVTRITSSNIEPGSITTDRLASGVSGGPKIVNVVVADSSYNVLDDTAISTSGGYVRITGSGFNPGCSVLVGNSVATSTSFVSSNFLNAQLPALPAGTYPMYVVNPDGATAIRVNAITYSLTPTWITGSTLPSQVTDSSFSVQLNATSNSNVVYSVAPGSSLPTGVTLSSAGLLSGTITGLAQDTVFSFIVEAIDAENQESPRTFSVTVSAGDANITQTMLLLQADNNTFITDASDNAFTITPNGATRPSAFSPYNTNWSNYFDGNGGLLSIPPALSTFQGLGANNFSYECFVYPLKQTNTYVQGLISYGQAGSLGTSTCDLVINASGYFQLAYATGASPTLLSPSLAQVNAWTHIVVCRTGSTLSMFVNGSRVATEFTSATVGSGGTVVYIGNQWYAIEAARQLQGYISNAMVLIGSSDYDATQTTITVPTAPLTAISGTSLLTCQSNRLIDNSTNNFTITKNGDVKVTAFAPFPDSDTSTGSGYFDGTGDYLTAASNTAFAIGTGDFCIEGWYFVYANKNYNIYFDFRNGADGVFPYLYSDSTGFIDYYVNGVSRIAGSGVIKPGQWSHIAVIRSGTDTKLFINGVQIGSTYTDSNNYVQGPLYIGRNNGGGTTYDASYYCAGFRVVKGTTGGYGTPGSTITVPSAPLTAVSGTSLLTLQNRTGYNNSQPIDESGIRNVITRNGNTSVGSFSPYVPSGWSVHLATDRSVSFTGNASTTLDGDFTFETWVYLTSYVGGGFNELTVLTNRSDNSVGTNIDIANSNGGSPGTFGLWYNGSTIFVTPGAGDVALNVWTHLAITREGTGTNNLKAFINGVLKAQATSTATFFGTNTMYIGDSMYNQQFNNYMSNMRMIKGRALYTTSAVLDTAVFTPPAYTLSPTEDTSFLLFRDGNYVKDSGPQRLTITPGASAPIAVAFSPFKPHTCAPLSHSVYFDGTGDYLTTPTSANLVCANNVDWTIDFFIYTTSFATTQVPIFSSNGSDSWSSSHNFGVYVNTSGYILFEYSESNLTPLTVAGTTALTLNVWNHVALVFDGVGKTLTTYVNGTRDLNASSISTYNPPGSTPKITIGRTDPSVPSPYLFYVNGYISNVRFTTSAELYNGTNINVPTTPLTAISGTSLLTCQSPTAIDNSDNAFALTVNGNTQPTRFNPFGETVATGVEYSPVTHGGSVYFPYTTNDQLNLNGQSDFAFGTGDFSVEMWYYISNPAVVHIIYEGRASGEQTNGVLSLDANTLTPRYNASATTRILGTGVNAYCWNHFLLTRKLGSTRIFVNGTQSGSTYADGTNYTTSAGRPIFGNHGFNATKYPAHGYFSDIKIQKGFGIASAFSPPAARNITLLQNPNLWISGTNAAIQDKTGRTVLETVGNARVVNSVKKFGSGAMSFDGTGDWVLVRNSDILSGDFTIEFWINYTTTSSSAPNSRVFCTTTTGNVADNLQVILGTSSEGSGIGVFSNAFIHNFSTAKNDGNWHHVAISRESGQSRFFINGALEGSAVSTSQSFTLTNSLIGTRDQSSGTSNFTGYIDDLRITKGVARYDLPFDPPGKHLAR